MATVEKRHREAAALAVKPDWRRDDALEEPTIGVLRRVAQALAEAEQRGAESAKAEAQPAGTGWVSVEERLPPEDELSGHMLLAYHPNWSITQGFLAADGVYGEWAGVEMATHWAYVRLPPPPERDR